MTNLNPTTLVAPLLALQFVVFGWRLVREIAVEERGGRTWLLASDLVNLVSMIAVVVFCVVIPLKSAAFPRVSLAILGAGYVLIVFTPIVLVGHYRLFTREGRSIYAKLGRDYPRLTGQEALILAVAVLAAVAAAYAIWTA